MPQLIDTILINPTVNIEPSYRDTGAQCCAWRAGSSWPPVAGLCALPPAMALTPGHRRRLLGAGLTATYAFQPLSNLVYTRDQQITTCQGIVMGRLRSPQRNLEVSLMRFCLEKLGELRKRGPCSCRFSISLLTSAAH